jgi:hypothetical protein
MLTKIIFYESLYEKDRICCGCCNCYICGVARVSLFVVLPEQYSRGVYPSGLIGINIDGKFFVSKYEGNTSARSVVLGVVKGDFVLDAVEGNYQRIVSASSSRAARSISDSELEDVNADTSNKVVSYRFTESDFVYGYDAELLFSALPDMAEGQYLGNEEFFTEVESCAGKPGVDSSCQQGTKHFNNRRQIRGNNDADCPLVRRRGGTA